MKTVCYLSYNLLKILPTGGKSYPGYLFLRYAGLDSLGNLAKEQIKDGSILITGTNGKTTTTTMIIDLMSNDVNISKSVDNNTIYALTTALLAKKSDIGIFEYGIRDLKHGIPDVVEKILNQKLLCIQMYHVNIHKYLVLKIHLRIMLKQKHYYLRI